MAELRPPQLVINSRMLYLSWVPEDKDAVKLLVPKGLRPFPNHQCFINQYVVDNDEQTSHFGAYSLTYAGVDVQGLDCDGLPAHWWAYYSSSNPAMNAYAKEKGGTPSVNGGHTELVLNGDQLVATTYDNDTPIIRTTALVGPISNNFVRGHLRYITMHNGKLTSGHYPAIGQCADPFKVTKMEFLDPTHPVYAIRPKDPLEVVYSFYFHKAAFAYPGGQQPLSQEELLLSAGK